MGKKRYSTCTKPKRRINWKHLGIVVIIIIFMIGMGFGIDHFIQNRRKDEVSTVYHHYMQIQDEVKNFETTRVSDEFMKPFKELILEDFKKDFQLVDTISDAKRISSKDVKTVEKLKDPADGKYYQLFKLMDKIHDDEVEHVIKFVLREPEDRIDFTLGYKELDKYQNAPNALTESLDTVPSLIQWDPRWGYIQYGDMRIGYSGCAPTCLSMVLSYLNQDNTITPDKLATYSLTHNLYVDGIGTSHALLEQAANAYHVRVEGIPVDGNLLVQELNKNKIAILNLVPGEFTEVGHFIVVYGVEDGKLLIRDPNSKIRTAKAWEVDRLMSQTAGIWLYSK